MLIGFKGGESVLGRTQVKLKIKQMAFDIEQLAQGVISKSPLEFLKKGAEARELIIKKDRVSDPADPAAPPVEVTKISTPEQLARENAGALKLNDTGEIVYESQCFGYDTDVVMSDGTRVEIQHLEPGCTVLARCEETGELASCRVLNLFEHEKVETYHVVYINDEGYKDGVYTTAQHPFWVKGKGWTPVCELEPGQSLETHTGRVTTITEVKKTGYRDTVYNLEVEGFHTYFVGTMGVLVHNKNNTDTPIRNELPRINPDAVTHGIIPDITRPIASDYPLSKQLADKGEIHALTSIAETGRRTEFLPNDDFNLLGRDGSSHPDGSVDYQVADVFTPIDNVNKPESVASTVWKKSREQSSTVIVDLSESPLLNPEDIIREVEKIYPNPVEAPIGAEPNPGVVPPTLRELYIVRADGSVIHIEYPNTDANPAIYGLLGADGKTSKPLTIRPSNGQLLEVTAEGTALNIAPLSMSDVDSLLPAAKQYWLNAGALSSVLDGVQISIGQLPFGVAAQAQYNKITISTDGAGWGWFVDSTPLDSMEFINATSTQWIAPADSIAIGKLDLLTVMIHEMGHALGLQHDAAGSMEAVLQPGERNLPSDLEAALLQNIRNAVTAKASTFAVPATPVMQYQVVANPTVITLGANGWNTKGSVNVANGIATLNEVSTSQTRLSQVFMLGENDRYLSFTLSGAALDHPTGAPEDAFEVALLDANTGLSVLGSDGLTRTDAFLNLQGDGAQHAADCVTCIYNADGSRTYRVDLSGVAKNTAVNLSFDLLGFGANNSHVTLSDIRVSGLPQLRDEAATLAEDNLLTFDPYAQLPSTSGGRGAGGEGVFASRLVDAPAHGSITVNADGTFSYTPELNYFGADSFSYRLSDGAADSNLAMVSLTVTPVNDAPVAADVAMTTAEDTPLVIALGAYGSDVDTPPTPALPRRGGGSVGYADRYRTGTWRARAKRRRHLQLHAGSQLQRRG